MPASYYDENCIFCKILQRKIPSTILFESDAFFVFLDISPINKGHALIVPKKHMETVFDVDPSYGVELIAIIRRVGNAIIHATGATGMNVLQNNYSDAGQTVSHVHWHLIPRFANDRLFPWNPKSYTDKKEMETIADSIRSNL